MLNLSLLNSYYEFKKIEVSPIWCDFVRVKMSECSCTENRIVVQSLYMHNVFNSLSRHIHTVCAHSLSLHTPPWRPSVLFEIFICFLFLPTVQIKVNQSSSITHRKLSVDGLRVPTTRPGKVLASEAMQQRDHNGFRLVYTIYKFVECDTVHWSGLHQWI